MMKEDRSSHQVGLRRVGLRPSAGRRSTASVRVLGPPTRLREPGQEGRLNEEELDGEGVRYVRPFGEQLNGSKSGFGRGITIRVLSPPDPDERP
jgi:hypothetical protein